MNKFEKLKEEIKSSLQNMNDELIEMLDKLGMLIEKDKRFDVIDYYMPLRELQAFLGIRLDKLKKF